MRLSHSNYFYKIHSRHCLYICDIYFCLNQYFSQFTIQPNPTRPGNRYFRFVTSSDYEWYFRTLDRVIQEDLHMGDAIATVTSATSAAHVHHGHGRISSSHHTESANHHSYLNYETDYFCSFLRYKKYFNNKKTLYFNVNLFDAINLYYLQTLSWSWSPLCSNYLFNSTHRHKSSRLDPYTV